MTQISNNYGLVLLESAILANEIEDTKKMIFDQPMLLEALKSPIVSFVEKEKIIDAVLVNRTDTGNASKKISCQKSNDRMDREKEFDRWLYHTGWRYRNGLEHGRSFAAIRE